MNYLIKLDSYKTLNQLQGVRGNPSLILTSPELIKSQLFPDKAILPTKKAISSLTVTKISVSYNKLQEIIPFGGLLL